MDDKYHSADPCDKQIIVTYTRNGASVTLKLRIGTDPFELHAWMNRRFMSGTPKIPNPPALKAKRKK